VDLVIVVALFFSIPSYFLFNLDISLLTARPITFHLASTSAITSTCDVPIPTCTITLFCFTITFASPTYATTMIPPMPPLWREWGISSGGLGGQ